MNRLNRARLSVAVWEQRVLNAPSIDIGRRHHRKLDEARAKLRELLASQPPSTPREP